MPAAVTLLGGALTGAIQQAAAARDLADIHLDRAGFTQEVSQTVAESAARFGLTLVSAALAWVDQSNFAQLDETNAFNARGMRRLAELVAEQRRARIAVETGAEVAVREHQLVQHQRRLELKRPSVSAQFP